jgi:hypothetical protein
MQLLLFILAVFTCLPTQAQVANTTTDSLSVDLTSTSSVDTSAHIIGPSFASIMVEWGRIRQVFANDTPFKFNPFSFTPDMLSKEFIQVRCQVICHVEDFGRCHGP